MKHLFSFKQLLQIGTCCTLVLSNEFIVKKYSEQIQTHIFKQSELQKLFYTFPYD
jgi:hypothetical protein